MLVGPAVGTVLVLGLGAGAAFAIDAATFALSALLLARMHPRVRAVRGKVGAGQRAGTLSELRTGLREVRKRTWVWATILAYTLVMLCFYAPWMSLAPLVTHEIYGSVGIFGVFEAVSGAGAVLGSLLATVWHPRRPLFTALLLGTGWPATAILMALAAPKGLMIAWVLLEGVAGAIFSIIWDTALATYIPPQSLSRVSSYDWLGSVGLLPLGYALAGPLAGELGARTVLGVGGLIGALATLAALLPHATRELGAEREPAAVRVGAQPAGLRTGAPQPSRVEIRSA